MSFNHLCQGQNHMDRKGHCLPSIEREWESRINVTGEQGLLNRSAQDSCAMSYNTLTLKNI